MSFQPGLPVRSVWAILILPILLFCIFIPAGAQPGGPVKVNRGIMVMGTIAEVTVYGEDESKIDEAIEEAFTVFEDIDKEMSLYKDESELSRLNATAYENPVRISGTLMRLIEKSVWFSEITGGAFDITVGPLMEIWGFMKERAAFPDHEEVAAALEKVGYKKLLIDTESRTIGFKVSGMWIDLGGIAKGDAVDLAVEELRKKGIQSALVNLGGNMYALGSPPGETAWEVGIRNPLDAEGVVETLRLRNRAVATSGSYEKSIQIGPDIYSHIMDPRTGIPASGVLSVTVTADTALETDALSTAFFVLGYEGSNDLMNALNNVESLFILPDSNGKFALKKIGREKACQ